MKWKNYLQQAFSSSILQFHFNFWDERRIFIVPMKVLLIYHQPNLLLSLYRTLRRDYEIKCVASLSAATQTLQHNSFNIIIVDLDGAPASSDCGVLGTYAASTPIVVLATNLTLAAKIAMLDSGAYDCLAKPIDGSELLARLRVAVRHPSGSKPTHHRLVVGDFVLDTAKHIASRAGTPIVLRQKEFALLECLMRNAGNVVDAAVLATQAWEHEQEMLVSNLHVHINHLRNKIDKPFKTALIRTVHGMGYMLDLQSTAPLTDKPPTPQPSSRQISIL